MYGQTSTYDMQQYLLRERKAAQDALYNIWQGGELPQGMQSQYDPAMIPGTSEYRAAGEIPRSTPSSMELTRDNRLAVSERRLADANMYYGQAKQREDLARKENIADQAYRIQQEKYLETKPQYYVDQKGNVIPGGMGYYNMEPATQEHYGKWSNIGVTPGPSAEEQEKQRLLEATIAAKGKGVSGGKGGTGLTQATVTDLQKSIIDMRGQIDKAENVMSKFSDEMLTYSGKAANSARVMIDKAGGGRMVDKTKLTAFTQFQQSVDQLFNAYRKEITGAAAAEKELEMLKKAFMSTDLSPTQFRAAYKQFTDSLKRGLRLKMGLLRQGIQPGTEEFGKAFDEAFTTGSDDDIRQRSRELVASGMTPAQVAEQLTKEGY